MLVGMGTPVYPLPVAAATSREVDLLGVFRYANTYPEGIEILTRQKSPDSVMPDFSKLITHRYEGLSSVEEAFQVAGKTKDSSGAVVLKAIVTLNDSPAVDHSMNMQNH